MTIVIPTWAVVLIAIWLGGIIALLISVNVQLRGLYELYEMLRDGK